MGKILNLSSSLLILVVLAVTGLTFCVRDRGHSNIAPGTKFGRERMARKPYPYLYPVNPELWRHEKREMEESEPPTDEPSQSEPAKDESPVHKKLIRPKFIEVN